jgi:hypothetical protein
VVVAVAQTLLAALEIPATPSVVTASAARLDKVVPVEGRVGVATAAEAAEAVATEGAVEQATPTLPTVRVVEVEARASQRVLPRR